MLIPELVEFTRIVALRVGGGELPQECQMKNGTTFHARLFNDIIYLS
jgi:hypothetical protein